MSGGVPKKFVVVGKMIDSQFDTMSFRMVDETICPSSTNIAELDEIFSNVTANVPPLVVILSPSPTDQEFNSSLVDRPRRLYYTGGNHRKNEHKE